MMLPNTPEDIVAKLRMFRSRFPQHSLVLVEGPTDRALWAEYKSERCRLVPTGNKEKAVDAVRIIYSKTKVRGVVAVIDPDYWLVENHNLLQSPNLLYDDSPDVEIMMLTSNALEKVLRNTFVNVELDAIGEFANSLRAQALWLAIEFGYFRLIDYRNRDYNLMMRRVADHFEYFIDKATLRFKDEDVVATLVGESKSLTSADCLAMIATVKQEKSPSILLCRGKDAISLVALLLPLYFKRKFNRELSGRAAKQTTGNELTRALRIAFEFEHFAMTALHTRIRDWETHNIPFRILRDFSAERTTQ